MKERKILVKRDYKYYESYLFSHRPHRRDLCCDEDDELPDDDRWSSVPMDDFPKQDEDDEDDDDWGIWQQLQLPDAGPASSVELGFGPAQEPDDEVAIP